VQKKVVGTLWHKRIEHHSDKILKSIFDFKNLDCSSCEVCKLEKYTMLPFGHSICKSSKPFELIYSDVWGPLLLNHSIISNILLFLLIISLEQFGCIY
jgi:hypothetical protein